MNANAHNEVSGPGPLGDAGSVWIGIARGEEEGASRSGYRLTAPLEVHSVDGGSGGTAYLLVCAGRRFYVGAMVVEILRGIDGDLTLEEIDESLTARFPGTARAGVDAVRETIEAQLVRLGVVRPDDGEAPAVPVRRGRSRYIRATVTLLPPAAVEPATRPFRWLFDARAAIAAAVLIGGAHGAYLWQHGGAAFSPAHLVRLVSALETWDYVLLYGFLSASFLFHELGHAAAARRYGVSVGRIGAGIYIVIPVLFCDVSESWRLNKYRRIAIDVGGMYFQLLLSSALILLLFMGARPVLAYALLLNTLSILYSLNPFLRYDGYWIYSDYFEIPNLRAQSFILLRRLAARVRSSFATGLGSFRIERDEGAAAAYAILSVGFFGYFGYVLVRVSGELIATAPETFRSIAAQAAHLSTPGDVLALASRLAYVGIVLVIAFVLLRATLGGLLRRRARPATTGAQASP